MSGKEERQIHLTSRQEHSSSMRVKVILGVVVCLCVLTAVAAVVAVVTVTTNSSRNDDETAHAIARSIELLPEGDDINLESLREAGDEHQVKGEARRYRRATTNPRTRSNNTQATCITYPTNDSVPAAHIKGHGGKFPRSTKVSTEENPLAPIGYQQRWRCNQFDENANPNAHAFVDGGMIFNQDDKSIHVPECGYYHVFSQIHFQVEPTLNKSVSVKHSMQIERNCPSWPDRNAVLLQAKASVGPFDGHSGSGAVTTYTSDVIRLCNGGRIWVEITDTVNDPCCPMGDGTFMGAVLVSKTSCHWPPMVQLENLDDPDHQL